jgi:hypothetical protein
MCGRYCRKSDKQRIAEAFTSQVAVITVRLGSYMGSPFLQSIIQTSA